MVEMSQNLRLVLITTVPVSLLFFTDHIANAKARGLEVHVLSSPGHHLRKLAEAEKVVPHEVQMYRGISPLRDLVAIFKTWRVLRTIRPDIVHAATPKGGLIGMIAASMNKVPIRIFHILGFRFVTTTGVKRWLLCLSERVACALCHKAICVSNSIQQVAIEERICKPAKASVPAKGSVNGIDAARFSPGGSEERIRCRGKFGIPEGAFVVGYVGRVVRDKGLMELVMAWQNLRISFPTMRLLIAGWFESQDPLPSEIEQLLRSDPSIYLAGEVSEILNVYKAIDLLVLPTYREGFPLVLLEAAAMGLPAVATSVSGCVDAVQDGITGTLVPPYDSAALADAIGRYAQDEALCTRHGMAARDRVLRDFRSEDVASALWYEYEHLMEKQQYPKTVQVAA